MTLVFIVTSTLGLATPSQDLGENASAIRDSDLKTLVEGNNAFAFDMYAQLAKKEGNIVFSPYSISSALAMTYAGARGETAQQMAKVLHFSLGQGRLHGTFGPLIGRLHASDKKQPYHLLIANSLWGQQGYPFVDDFLNLTRKNYCAGLNLVDFKSASDEARATINRWVEQQTKEKIKELLRRGDVDEYTRLVLANAIYFNATWKSQFPKDLTKNAPFHVSATQKVSVPLMRQDDIRLKYYEGDGFQWLELPYKGDRLSMLLLLPQKQGELAELERTLSAEFIGRGIDKLRAHSVTVRIPRFKSTLRCLLATQLRAMGMPLPFSKSADFSGITPEQPIRLRIGEVIHQAHVEVDELGTEAAAATATILFQPTSNASPTKLFFFRADHPFLFVIRDLENGTILFLGRVSDPQIMLR